MITRFIADHQGHRDGRDGLRWGAELICTQLTELGVSIAPSAYHGQLNREPSDREVRDEDLKPQIARVHAANYGVYEAHKVWLALNREGTSVARCTVERLWVADLTYASTWSAFAYVAFVVDAYARRILGWRVDQRWRPRWCSMRSSRPSGRVDKKVSSISKKLSIKQIGDRRADSTGRRNTVS